MDRERSEWIEVGTGSVGRNRAMWGYNYDDNVWVKISCGSTGKLFVTTG